MRYLLCLLLAGCVVTSKEYNQGIRELNKFHKDFTKKTGELGEAVQNINEFHLDEAKKENDSDAIERWAENRAKVHTVIEGIEELSDFEMEEAKGVENALMSLINGILEGIMNNPTISTIISLMGGGGALGAIKLYKTSAQNRRLKSKGKKFAESTEVDKLHDDEDFN